MGRLVEQLAGGAGARDRRPRRRGPRRVGRRPTWRSTSRPPTRCGRISAATSSAGCRWSSARPAGRQTRSGFSAEAEAASSASSRRRTSRSASTCFELMVAEAARLMPAQPQYGAWIHEAHHAAKRDAPSGTALLLRDAMIGAGFGRAIDMSSTRAGMIPGTHTVGFDGRLGYDRADAHGARSPRIRRRRAAGRAVDSGTPGVVLAWPTCCRRCSFRIECRRRLIRSSATRADLDSHRVF